MKKYLLFASAALALASCTTNEYLGDADAERLANGEKAIGFNIDVPAFSRAEGTAGKPNGQFFVYAEKNESGKDAPAEGNLVIKNYVVKYTTGSGKSTTSNSDGWEYVGLTLTANERSYVTENSGDNAQTIKFWDNSASSYTFTAISAKPDDIKGGKVKIAKTTAGDGTQYDKGYVVTVTDDAGLASLYFADRVNVEQTNYGKPVKFTFRNGQTQVRVGMYETIPGYQVKITKFYYAADNDAPAFADMTTEEETKFTANVPNQTFGEGTFTVKYKDASVAAVENQPIVTFTPKDATNTKKYIQLGEMLVAGYLGEDAENATYDKTDKAFTAIAPQEDNGNPLKLKVDYQLYNSVTGETIDIKGKTAEVPAEYLKWKPNYKYTYLFKITDSDLTPITFYAVVIEAENGEAEYITTVTEPSITTFGVKEGKYTTDGTEYAAGSDIYVTIVKESTVIDPASVVKVYAVTTSDATNFPITEGSVAQAITSDVTGKITATEVTSSNANTYFGTAPAAVSNVPAEDGTTITIKALKLENAKAGTYAVEYTYDTDKKAYKVIVVK